MIGGKKPKRLSLLVRNRIQRFTRTCSRIVKQRFIPLRLRPSRKSTQLRTTNLAPRRHQQIVAAALATKLPSSLKCPGFFHVLNVIAKPPHRRALNQQLTTNN